MPSGKTSFTHIKDKKIAIYKPERKIVPPGIDQTIFVLIGGGRLWANYRSVSGSEKFAARTDGFDGDVSFVINWRKDIAQGFHVVFRDKVYEITWVDDLEGYKKELKLACKLLETAMVSDYSVV